MLHLRRDLQLLLRGIARPLSGGGNPLGGVGSDGLICRRLLDEEIDLCHCLAQVQMLADGPLLILLTDFWESHSGHARCRS